MCRDDSLGFVLKTIIDLFRICSVLLPTLTFSASYCLKNLCIVTERKELFDRELQTLWMVASTYISEPPLCYHGSDQNWSKIIFWPKTSMFSVTFQNEINSLHFRLEFIWDQFWKWSWNRDTKSVLRCKFELCMAQSTCGHIHTMFTLPNWAHLC